MTSSQTPLAVDMAGVTKSFGKDRGLAGVDLAVAPGSVYGLLGPNGAGKTTTIKVLTTLLRPDGGQARVFGHDVVREPNAVRRRISLTGQYASVDEDLTGAENLVLLARLHGFSRRQAAERAEQLLDVFGLAEAGGRGAKTYSGGMRRRLDIAASIVNTPALLFLDEPTTGLDPRSRLQVWDIVRAVVDHGTTVLLTTQYLEEADRLAGRIAVIDQGRVIAEGTPGELKASVGGGTLRVRLRNSADRDNARRVLGARLEILPATESDLALITARLGEEDGTPASARASRILEELDAQRISVDEFSLGQPSLDEVFLSLTDHPAHDASSDAVPEEVAA